MVKNSAECVFVTSFVVISFVSLPGCFEEDYPNYSAEAAYQGGTRRFQLWTGNENHPENPEKIPWPNGKGHISMGSIGDVDCWPVSLFDPETWEVGDVAYFQLAVFMEPYMETGVFWSGRESFRPALDEWDNVSQTFLENNSSEAQWVYWTVPVVDEYLLYSLDFWSASYGDTYGFGLIPIYNE